MYSRKRAETIYDTTPGQIPYHYGGTRFGRQLGSDGREEIFDKGFLPLEREEEHIEQGASGRGRRRADGGAGQTGRTGHAGRSTEGRSSGGSGNAHGGEGNLEERIDADSVCGEAENSGGMVESGCGEFDSGCGTAEPSCGAQDHGFGSFLSRFENDDLILIALILFLAGEGEENKGAILLLLYLLASDR